MYGIEIEANVSQIYGDYGTKKLKVVEENRTDCKMYYSIPAVAEIGDILYKAVGKRDDSYCSAILNPCIESQKVAIKAKCPGVYIGANDNICVVARNAVEDSTFFSKQRYRCTKIPINE